MADGPQLVPSPSAGGIIVQGPNQGIITQGQSGGRNTVNNNFGPPRRLISSAARTAMVSVLNGMAKGCANVTTSISAGPEGVDFAAGLVQVFAEAGWETNAGAPIFVRDTLKDIAVTVPDGKKPLDGVWGASVRVVFAGIGRQVPIVEKPTIGKCAEIEVGALP